MGNNCLLDPTMDFIFKRIFGNEQEPEILICFLNAILEPYSFQKTYDPIITLSMDNFHSFLSGSCWYTQKFVRTKNRQLHKATIDKGGVRKSNQVPQHVFGFQLFDKVEYQGQEAFIFGRRVSGTFDIRKLDGTKLSAGVSYKKLNLLEKRKSLLTEIQY